MDIFAAIVYGIIQGFSEFLPVSSSGHLALLPMVMVIPDPGVVFDLGMHLGTALAVMIYFRERLIVLVKSGKEALFHWNSENTNAIFLQNFLVATLASVLLILLLRPYALMARSPWIIAFNQCFFGLMLWLAEWRYRHRQPSAVDIKFERRHLLHAMVIGLSQALAIFPGVSRSGITLSAAFMLGVGRHEAGSFSFLLSLPIIVGGALVELPSLLAMPVIPFSPVNFFIGVLTSFVIGYVTIHYFMKLIGRIHLGWFTLYRLVLALVLVWFLL